jgi:type IV secretory pathway VirB10-like protein
MSRLPLVATALAAILFAAPRSFAQRRQQQNPSISLSAIASSCQEVPGGKDWRFVCPPPPMVFDEIPEPFPAPQIPVALKLPEGTPLRIAIDQRTRISHVGEQVHGYVVEAVYAFDQAVIPAGSLATGRVTSIDPVSTWRRAGSYANGNFSPFHHYTVTFDRLLLPDGRVLVIDTTVAPGSEEVIHLITKGAKNRDEQEQQRKDAASRAAEQVKDRAQEAAAEARQAADDLRSPGKLERLKKYVLSQSPYRKQYVTEGTRFSAALNQQLDFGIEPRSAEELSELGEAPPPDTVLHARLVMEVNSETAQRGDPVVAQLTEPLFSEDHRLLLPADSRLIGRVLEAKPARRLHRNGELRIIFEHVELPGGNLQSLQGTLEGIEVDRAAHLKLDEEGGAHATDSATRYLSTALAVLVAAAAAHPEVEHGSIEQADDPAVRAGAGASGFGLVGTVVGLASKSNAVSIVFSAYGASASIYTNFIARGHNVVLPKNAPLEIGLGAPHPAAKRR